MDDTCALGVFSSESAGIAFHVFNFLAQTFLLVFRAAPL